MSIADSFNERLVNRISRTENIDDRIIKAFKKMKRHYFMKFFFDIGINGGYKKIIFNDEIKQDAKLMEYIYSNQAIPTVIKEGRPVSSISQPTMNAIILQMLKLKEGLNILEIGSGTGWLSALILDIMNYKGFVTGVEIDKELVESSRKTMKELNLKNIEIIQKDGSDGYKENAPYDRIVFTAASKDIPDFVYKQLKKEGLVLLPLMSLSWNIFSVLRKTKYGLISTNLSMASFVPLYGNINSGYYPYTINLNSLKSTKDNKPIKLLKKIHIKEITSRYKKGFFDFFRIRELPLKLFLYAADERASNFVYSYESLNVGKIAGFGLYDTDKESYCVYKDKQLFLYGKDEGNQSDMSLLKKFISIIGHWIELDMPGIEKLKLIIIEDKEASPDLDNEVIISKRKIRDKTYVWIKK